MQSNKEANSPAKPFLKWAGGKSQLIPAIEAALPAALYKRKSLVYVEPFIGSGAVLFWFLQKFTHVKKAVINDVNKDLTQAYTVVKKQPNDLVKILQRMQDKYDSIKSEADRKIYYLEKKTEYNSRQLSPVQQSALLIFLNKTCFNGLYRVNSKNEFNVPFGKYERPKICDPRTILADSKILQRVTILNGDYEETINYCTEDSFFYFDPPYKPVSETSSFNAYAKYTFDDGQQVRLRQFCDRLSARGVQWLLSNSDPKNKDAAGNFFDELYGDESLFITRTAARRTINSNASKRGAINELLICNYQI